MANGILDNIRFSYETAGTVRYDSGRFDHNHFRFNKVTAILDSFSVANDTIALELKYLSGKEENSGLRLKRLRYIFNFSNTKIIKAMERILRKEILDE